MTRTNFLLTPEQRADARAALALLDGSGVSLEEAARRAIGGLRGVHRVTLAEAVERFSLGRLRAGVRRATHDWYEERLAKLVREMGNRILDTVSQAELVEAVSRLHPTASAGAATYRACRALWRWASLPQQGMVAEDITRGLVVRVRPREGRAPAILTVDECQRLMSTAGRHRSAVALMLFAGVRPHEVCGPQKAWLTWRSINVDDRLVRIPANIAKTGRKRGAARIIEGLPEALWAWIEPGLPDETVAKAEARQVMRSSVGRIGYGNERFGGVKPWPQDALRHTFATYALAYTADPGKVAYWLGHEGNPRMLYNHYRGLAMRSEAEAFFALRPTA